MPSSFTWSVFDTKVRALTTQRGLSRASQNYSSDCCAKLFGRFRKRPPCFIAYAFHFFILFFKYLLYEPAVRSVFEILGSQKMRAQHTRSYNYHQLPRFEPAKIHPTRSRVPLSQLLTEYNKTTAALNNLAKRVGLAKLKRVL